MQETLVELVDGSLVDVKDRSVVVSEKELSSIVGKDVKLSLLDGNELALGISMPTSVQPAADYLRNMNEWKFTKSDAKKKMEICEKMYLYEGIVGSALDILVELANTPIVLEGVKDDKSKELLDYVTMNLNKTVQTVNSGMSAFIDRGMTYYLVYGDVFPYESWRTFKVAGNNYKIPNIIYLNPQNIEIDDSLVAMGVEQLKLKIDQGGGKQLKGLPTEYLKNSILEDIKKGGGKENILDPLVAKHIKRKGRDWDAWGTPFLQKAFSAVASKKRLRKLDDTTTEGLINYLTVFKIGSKDYQSPYHKVSRARLTAFAALIANPHASTTLVWPHDLEVITAGPDGKVLEFKDKYAQANLDILESLGLGAGLLENSRVTEEKLLVLIEVLEGMREPFINYVNYLYQKILEENKLVQKDAEVEPVKVSMKNIRVQDILQRLKSLILSYYDRGLLSKETALTDAGYTYTQELDRKRDEKNIESEELFNVPNLPFSTKKEEVDPQRRDDGRPTNKLKDDKPKIDNDIKLDKPKQNIGMFMKGDQFYIDTYHDGLLDRYTKLRDKLTNEISEKGFDENAFDLVLSAGFLQLRTYTSKYLKLTYDAYNGELDIDEKDYMYQKLEGWNLFHLDKFKRSVSSIIKKGARVLEDADAELIAMLVTSVFDKEINRLSLYAGEGFYKARMAGTLEAQAKDDMQGGFWVTMGDDKVCDTCSQKDGNWYTIDDIFNEYPSHPRCRCEIDFTKENPIIANPNINNDVVRTNPANPNKPL